MTISGLLAKLIADNPSLQAAAKAGKKTSISARVYRAKTDTWEDLGVISEHETSWASVIRRLKGFPRVIVRYTVGGKEIERQ